MTVSIQASVSGSNFVNFKGKFDLGGVWMMVSIQASVSGSNFVIFSNLCLLWLCCHKSPKRGRL
jgi:hypothetical protein